jgi:hypothetical protein
MKFSRMYCSMECSCDFLVCLINRFRYSCVHSCSKHFEMKYSCMYGSLEFSCDSLCLYNMHAVRNSSVHPCNKHFEMEFGWNAWCSLNLIKIRSWNAPPPLFWYVVQKRGGAIQGLILIRLDVLLEYTYTFCFCLLTIHHMT